MFDPKKHVFSKENKEKFELRTTFDNNMQKEFNPQFDSASFVKCTTPPISKCTALPTGTCTEQPSVVSSVINKAKDVVKTVQKQIQQPQSNEGFCSSGGCGSYGASTSASNSCNGCGGGAYANLSSCGGGYGSPWNAVNSCGGGCGGCGNNSWDGCGSVSQFRSFNDTDNMWSYSSMITCAPGTSFPLPSCPCNMGPQAIPNRCGCERPVVIPSCQGNFELIRPYQTNYTSCGTPCGVFNPYIDKGCRGCSNNIAVYNNEEAVLY